LRNDKETTLPVELRLMSGNSTIRTGVSSW
jgi:hypothetical protein